MMHFFIEKRQHLLEIIGFVMGYSDILGCERVLGRKNWDWEPQVYTFL